MCTFSFIKSMIFDLSGPPSEVIPQYTDCEPAAVRGSSRANNSSSLETVEREIAVATEEERCFGTVKADVYLSYWKNVGLYLAPIILASIFLMQSTPNVSDWWLAHWVSPSVDGNSTIGMRNQTSAGRILETIDLHWFSLYRNTSSDPNKDVAFYLGIYAALAVANTVFTFMRAFLFAYGGLKAAQAMHAQLVDVVLKVYFFSIKIHSSLFYIDHFFGQAKVIFFDCTPVGRILNRFSSDVYTVDDSLPFMLNIFLAQIFGLFGECFQSLADTE